MPTRRNLLVALAGFAAALRAPASAAATGSTAIEFWYFGTVDCPICAAFRADGLADLRTAAEAAGIAFTARETASLRDLHKPGVFDEVNPLWLKIVRRSGHGVPAFALVDAGKFIDSRAGEWRDLLVLAVARAKKASAS